MSRKDRFNSPKIKSEISISPDLVGPTFPPIPSFTLPTGITGPTGNTALDLPDPHLTLIFVQKKMVHSLLLLLQIFKYRMVI